MEGLIGIWCRARERLARWGIIAVLQLTQTELAADSGQQVVVREWRAREPLSYGPVPERKAAKSPRLGREYGELSTLKRFKKSKSKELN